MKDAFLSCAYYLFCVLALFPFRSKQPSEAGMDLEPALGERDAYSILVSSLYNEHG